MIPEHIDWYQFFLMMAALIICITIHEFSHAYSAWRAGDETPKAQGRISLNPLDHLDPMGTVMMFITALTGFGIGWGKPVLVNPYNFKHPRWDNLRVSLWGPVSNLLTAVVTGLAVRFVVPALMRGNAAPSEFASNFVMFLILLTEISIGLAVFNLIPIPPLDGSKIFSALLPYEQAKRFDYTMGRYGSMIFLALIFIGPSMLGFSPLSMLIGPPRHFLFKLLTGF